MKIAAVAILYHPTSNFIENLATYQTFVDKIYVFDNTEEGCDLKEQIVGFSKVEYYHDGVNNAIAQRLNIAAKKAISEGFDWLLMMDQDSKFINNSLEYYLKGIENYPLKASIPVFCLNYLRESKESSPIAQSQAIDLFITSGSVLNLSLFPVIGDFDEALFIDFVDTEYSLRCKKLGYKIIQFTNIFLVHQLGTLVKRASIKTLFLKKKLKTVYSPIRYYYLCKNNLYIQKKYHDLDAVLMKNIQKATETHLNRGIFYGKNPFKILANIVVAHWDFRRAKHNPIL
jgi:rhamnosyltransferase